VDVIFVKDGETVEAGRELFSYKNDDKANFALEDTKKALTTARQNLKYAEEDVNKQVEKVNTLTHRYNELVERITTLQNAGLPEVPKEMEQTVLAEWRAQLATKSTELDAQKDALTPLERARDTAKTTLLAAETANTRAEANVNRKVVAKKPGIVMLTKGDTTSTGAKPVVQLLPLEMKVAGTVSEYDFNKLSVGASVTMTVISTNGKVNGEITKISTVPTASEAGNNGNTPTSTFAFYIKPEHALQYGFNLQISVPQPYMPIEKKALVRENGKTYLYFVEKDKAVKTEVTTTLYNGAWVIKGGLEKGKTYVTNPDTKITDGMDVMNRA
jgi:multidrug resistance efflux pump